MKQKSTVVLLALLLICVVGGSAAAESEPVEELPFTMPQPEGWRSETIPFPLPFAPELAYRGLEEVRLPGGMFEPESPEFWSYVFAWWLPIGTDIEAGRLEQDLVLYYRGLAETISGRLEYEPGPLEIEAELEPVAGRKRQWNGSVAAFDPFVTRKALRIAARITLWDCLPDHRVVFFELSPQPMTHAIWETLAGIREGFSCPAD
ncbi:MAG: hypothetical protein AAF604_17270 [Acidobacteriota bacterium]